MTYASLILQKTQLVLLHTFSEIYRNQLYLMAIPPTVPCLACSFPGSQVRNDHESRCPDVTSQHAQHAIWGPDDIGCTCEVSSLRTL